MQQMAFKLTNKYTRLEIAFFVFYYFLFGLFTDLEIQLFEPSLPPQLSHIDVLSHLIIGLVKVIPVWLLYKFIIERYFFTKRYLSFFILLFIYFFALNFYNLYTNLLVSKLTFLPAGIVKTATVGYHAKTWFHFGGIMYTLREYLVLAFFAYFVKSAKQEDQMNILKEEQLNAELKYLKIQMQPHFFFNTLNNIYALTLKKSDKAAPLVAGHADIMRYILYQSSKELTQLQQEVDFLKNYVEVEALRYADSISINFETQGINNSFVIEPLLLLPIIENTFKHGLREETGEGFVNIVICLLEDELIVETCNSKSAVANADNKTGIGLKNMQQRLKLLYPDKHTLEIVEDRQHYELRLTVKLKAHD